MEHQKQMIAVARMLSEYAAKEAGCLRFLSPQGTRNRTALTDAGGSRKNPRKSEKSFVRTAGKAYQGNRDIKGYHGWYIASADARSRSTTCESYSRKRYLNAAEELI
eukprot:3324622-Amphidinium_carterae.2